MKYHFNIYENGAIWGLKIWRNTELIYSSGGYASAILAMKVCHSKYSEILKGTKSLEKDKMRIEIIKYGLVWYYAINLNNERICSGGSYTDKLVAILASYGAVKIHMGLIPEIISVCDTPNTFTYDAIEKGTK